MEVSLETPRSGIALVRLSGRLDLLSSTQIKQWLPEIMIAGSLAVILDMSAVPFVDSSGLGAIVSLFKATRQAGSELRISQVNDQLRVILELTTLDKTFLLYPTNEAALEGLL